MTVAALFVQRGGCYWDLEGVDPWDEARDARKYAGPHPVVAHPPCARWCQLAHIVKKRYGYEIGDDGGCFASALESVRTYGGVLEHPAFSYAWPAHDLPRPERGRWTRDLFDEGWVCEVSQAAYGHRARKLTWLYAVCPEPPDMDWRRPAPVAGISDLRHRHLKVSAVVSGCANHSNSPLPRIFKKEASKTPPAFRDLLLSLARSASGVSNA